MIVLNGLGHGWESTSTNNLIGTKHIIIIINWRNHSFLIHKKMELLFTLEGIDSLFEPSPTKHCKISRCGRRLREFLSEHGTHPTLV
jgi:hypothetical protein